MTNVMISLLDTEPFSMIPSTHLTTNSGSILVGLENEYDHDQHTVNCGVGKSDVVDPSNMFNPEVI